MSMGEGWCGCFNTPVYSYRFHALTAYLHSTFTIPPIGGAFEIQSNIYGGNSQRVKTVGYLRRRAPSCIFDSMFDRIINATLPNNLLQLEGLRRSFPPLELPKGILDSPCLLIPLIYTNNKTHVIRWQIRLTRVNNSRAVAHKSWVVRCSPAFQDFNRSNKHCQNPQLRSQI